MGYLFLTFSILTIIIVLFLLNSNKTIQWAADRYAPQYGFSYTQISGGLLSGLEVDGLTFKDAKLLESLKVGWNPASLLFNKISLTHLEASGLNVDTIKKAVEAFTDEEDNSTFVLPVSIGVGKLELTVDPFEESGIGFKDISLEGKGFDYYGDGVDIDDLSLSIDTNVTTIELNGGIQDKKIRLKKLRVLDIDTIVFQDVIKKIADINIKKDIIKQVGSETKEYKTGNQLWAPQSVAADSVFITVKPVDYPQVRINQGELNITSVSVNIYGILDRQRNSVHMESHTVLLDTNLSRLSMQSTFKDDKIMIESLSVRDIDTIALGKLFKSLENDQTAKAETKVAHKEKGADANNTLHPLIPKFIYLKHMDTSIKSVKLDAFSIKSSEVNATNMKFDMGTLAVVNGEVDVRTVSNYAALVQHAAIKGRHVESKGSIRPFKDLYEIYDIPFKEDAFGTIPLHVNADEKQVVVDFDLKGEKILQAKEGAFNIEHLFLKNHLIYLISEDKLTVESEGNISTPHAKNMHLKNLLTQNRGDLDYKGVLIPGKIEVLDNNYTKPLNDLKITYHGDSKSIEVEIDSEGVKGKFVSSTFEKGDLTLSTKQPLALKNMLSLPKALDPAKASVDIHIPLDLMHMMPLKVKVKVTSNLANIDADLFYDKELKVMTKTIFPEDSLLRAFSKELNLDALNPLQADLTMTEKDLDLDVKSKGLTSIVKFNRENKNIDGNMVLGGAEFIVKGNAEKKLSLDTSVSSLAELLQKISTIYTFKVPPLDGDAELSLVLTDMEDLALHLNSHELIYKADLKKEYILNDTMLSLGLSDSVLTLNQYHTTFQGEKVFATKPSVISLKDNNIEIEPLWINDTLQVTGIYNLETKKGDILAFADPLIISHEIADLESRIDVKSSFDGVNTALNGTVTILGGKIHYDMDTKTFSSDSDIVDAEELKEEEHSLFIDNLVMSIKVNTEKPFIYKTAEADMQANAELLIHKAAKGPVGILGTVELLNGSTYTVQNKKFILKKSAIVFTGDPYTPILDIVAVYKTVSAEINIQVTGNLRDPHFIFSSIPRMSREKILSTILFDTQVNDQDMSENDMMQMMGGTMAQSVFSNPGGAVVKSVFSNVGINIDSIPFVGSSSDANGTKKAFLAFFSSDEEDVIPSHEIHFRGQKNMSEKTIQKAMGVDRKSIFAFWKEDKPSIDDRLLPALETSLQNFYDSEGYYDAEFSIKTSKTDVIVHIDEKDPVKILDINISSDYDISDLVTLEKGKIFRSKDFVSVKKSIIKKLLKEGYCSYDLDSKAYVDLDTHEVNIVFKLKSDGICTFGEVSVKGLETIDDDVVISRVRAKKGERYSTKKIEDTYDALNSLDAFDFISVKHDRKFYNEVPIDIEGSEVNRPWYFRADADFDSADGLRLSAEVLRTNFMGNAKTIRLGLTYSTREKIAELSYFVPALFSVSDYTIDLTSNIGYTELRYKGFFSKKTYAEAFLSYSNEKLNLNAGVAMDNTDITLRGYDFLHRIEPGNFSSVYPFLGFTYDSRNSKIRPKDGYYIEGMLEYGLAYDNKASSYLKYTLEGRTLYTFHDFTLSAIAKAGIVDQKDNEMPESKLFFAGGVHSNRAYGYNRIGVIYSPTEYSIEGGSTMANLSLEANYPLTEDLYAAVFTDNTLLTKDEYDFSGDILSSVGLALRYITPIAPIRLDVGMNVQDTSQYVIHFQIEDSF